MCAHTWNVEIRIWYTQIVPSIKPVAIFILFLTLVSGFILFNKPQTSKTFVQSPTPTLQNGKVYPDSIGVNIKASFAIITGNITRSLEAEKYHNQSPDVYIDSVDATIVHVKKSGITWDDFFKTLPMKLTRDCLITGDGETLCAGANGTLKFYLNNIETLDLLDRRIKDRDNALINFSPQR